MAARYSLFFEELHWKISEKKCRTMTFDEIYENTLIYENFTHPADYLNSSRKWGLKLQPLWVS